MARGISTTHPQTAALLRELGFSEDDVTQSHGSAVASAGFHEPESTLPKFSSCFDLRWDAVTKTLRDKLVAASVCVFPRDWPENRHVHCVQVGLANNAGKCTILPGPRTQIRDFFSGRNGLFGHGAWAGKWRPTDSERHAILSAYGAWVPDVATRVYVGEDRVLCYAWLEAKKQVCCEVRALAEGLGARILQASASVVDVRKADGSEAEIGLPGGYIAGEFLRAPVRPIAEALGYEVGFEWATGNASCVVRLTKGGA
jgi:hypothetical protein